MKRSFLVRAATLFLSLTGLALAILHGCSSTSPAPTKDPTTGAPAASASAASSQEEPPPAYLGATKAAVVIPPHPAQSAKK